ncbi:MAG: hypothetical protein JF616_16555 [Fibrobacteres bacterium]|nr:hypothetical protein [Fibrobacterota bacterium]
MNRVPIPSPEFRSQAGGGMLTIVATLGVLLVLAQGTIYYKAKGSAKFLGSEKSKVLAQQISEAGVEDNIADMGRHFLKIHSGMPETVTYSGKPFGGGAYTTRLVPVATGADADTVDLFSTGTVGKGSQTVQARMKLRKIMDTTRTPIAIVKPDTAYTYIPHSLADTARDTTIQDPNTMPQLDKTPAYSACMASSAKKCDICHLPSGDVTKANVISVSKSAISTHISHHGDYVSTDNTCDLYKPKVNLTITHHTVIDTTRNITDKTTYETAVVIDTTVKVQILSWR